MPDWDAAYNNAQHPLFGDAPTDFVREVVQRPEFQAKSVLCLADGDGRNGRWLAQQGMDVTAIDLSHVATEQALAKDQAAGVQVNRLVGDLAQWQFSDDAGWDAVFLIFLQCESRVRNRIARAASQCLMADGWFVAEGFSVDRETAELLGPRNPDLLYDVSQLEEACAGLRVLDAGTMVAELSEGVRHQGRAALARFVARRL
ncbi:MAG: class I SAM-dependent methyltransferase [Pseudomonadota bacterium]